MRRIVAVMLVGAALLFAAWILWPRQPPNDEALIREAVNEMARGAGEKKVGAILERVSEQYRGEGGSRDELKGYLLGYIMRSDWVTALPARVDVKVVGDSAESEIVVLLARGPAKSVAEIQPEGLAGSHHIEAKWAREGGTWKVVSASRRDASPGDWLR